MLRLMPSAVATGALLARPVARARVHGLGRLTAPTRSPWFWVALWISAATAGLVAQIPVLFDRGPPVPANEVFHNLSGVSFAACGLVAWRRRPDSAVGRLLTLTGCWLLLAPILLQIDSPPAFTVATLAGEMWIIG